MSTITDIAPVLALLVSIVIYSKLQASRRLKQTEGVPTLGLEQLTGADADPMLGGEAATGQHDEALYSSANHWLSGEDGPLSEIKRLLPFSRKENAVCKLR